VSQAAAMGGEGQPSQIQGRAAEQGPAADQPKDSAVGAPGQGSRHPPGHPGASHSGGQPSGGRRFSVPSGGSGQEQPPSWPTAGPGPRLRRGRPGPRPAASTRPRHTYGTGPRRPRCQAQAQVPRRDLSCGVIIVLGVEGRGTWQEPRENVSVSVHAVPRAPARRPGTGTTGQERLVLRKAQGRHNTAGPYRVTLVTVIGRGKAGTVHRCRTRGKAVRRARLPGQALTGSRGTRTPTNARGHRPRVTATRPTRRTRRHRRLHQLRPRGDSVSRARRNGSVTSSCEGE